MKVYFVSWSGGYEAPSYMAFKDKNEAWKLAKEWAKDMSEGEDTIDVVSIDLDTMFMERLEA